MTTELLNDRQGGCRLRHPKPQRQPELVALWRRKRTSACFLNKKYKPRSKFITFLNQTSGHFTSDNVRRKASH